MARGKQIEDFAIQHKLAILTIEELVAYRKNMPTMVINS